MRRTLELTSGDASGSLNSEQVVPNGLHLPRAVTCLWIGVATAGLT